MLFCLPEQPWGLGSFPRCTAERDRGLVSEAYFTVG